jgi:PPOX class probable F420-dependent enzyme
MKVMDEAQWRAFATTGTRTGKLAVTRPDGRPHVTPVWFVLDGDDVVLTTYGTSVKAVSLRHDTRAAMSVDDQLPPYSFVLIEGRAVLSEDLGELRRWAAAIGARYMGADRAQEFADRNGVPGELLVRLRISTVIARAEVAG